MRKFSLGVIKLPKGKFLFHSATINELVIESQDGVGDKKSKKHNLLEQIVQTCSFPDPI